MLNYLLGNKEFQRGQDEKTTGEQFKDCENTMMVQRQLRHLWSKKDLCAMFHFLTNHLKIWKFGLPIVLQSHAAHRWFYSERDYNKIDLIYRLQRQFNVKILLDEMFQ